MLSSLNAVNLASSFDACSVGWSVDLGTEKIYSFLIHTKWSPCGIKRYLPSRVARYFNTFGIITHIRIQTNGHP
jgi:hypothetical protein